MSGEKVYKLFFDRTSFTYTEIGMPEGEVRLDSNGTETFRRTFDVAPSRLINPSTLTPSAISRTGSTCYNFVMSGTHRGMRCLPLLMHNRRYV